MVAYLVTEVVYLVDNFRFEGVGVSEIIGRRNLPGMFQLRHSKCIIDLPVDIVPHDRTIGDWILPVLTFGQVVMDSQNRIATIEKSVAQVTVLL